MQVGTSYQNWNAKADAAQETLRRQQKGITADMFPPMQHIFDCCYGWKEERTIIMTALLCTPLRPGIGPGALATIKGYDAST